MPGATVLVGCRSTRSSSTRTNAARAVSSGSGWSTASSALTVRTRTAATSARNSTTGTYVLDGLVFPDLTPQPVLAEVRKAFEPVHLSVGSDAVRITNRYDVLDTTHLALHWDLADDGEVVAQGSLDLPVIAPGTEATVKLPDFSAPPQDRERWLTIRAVLANDTPWAPAGHEVAFTQAQCYQQYVLDAEEAAATGLDFVVERAEDERR